MPWPEDNVPKTVYPFPWIFHSFIPFFCNVPEPGTRVEMSPWGRRTPHSYSQQRSAVSPAPCKKKLLWLKLTRALIYDKVKSMWQACHAHLPNDNSKFCYWAYVLPSHRLCTRLMVPDMNSLLCSRQASNLIWKELVTPTAVTLLL